MTAIEAEKYFIVVPAGDRYPAFFDWDAYHATIERYGLDPGRSFICESMARAACDVAINAEIGIPASIWTIEGRVGPRRPAERSAA